MAGVSQFAIDDYVVVALFGLFLLRRAYRMTQGVPVSAARLAVMPAFYVLVYAAELAGTWFAGTATGRAELTYVGLAADVVLLAVGTWVAHRITTAHVELYQPAPGGPWYYRLRPLLPVLYVLLFFVRAGIETAIIGIAPFEFPSAAQFAGISPLALYALFTVDALWGLTTGFLIGRSAAVYGAWQRAKRNLPAQAPLSS